jgi:hypothetical protein
MRNETVISWQPLDEPASPTLPTFVSEDEGNHSQDHLVHLVVEPVDWFAVRGPGDEGSIPTPSSALLGIAGLLLLAIKRRTRSKQ